MSVTDTPPVMNRPLFYRWSAIVVVVALILYGIGRDHFFPTPPKASERFTHPLALGTNSTIDILPQEGVVPADAAASAFAQIDRVNQLMNPYDQTSDIARLNASVPGETVAVDPLTWMTLMEAMRYHRLSGGAFDVTVGPLLRLYKWKNATQSGEMGQLPDATSIAKARAAVGSEKLVFVREGMRVGFSVPGMRVDLGGIAKGLAVDLAVEALRRAGVKNALVNSGGEIRMIGSLTPMVKSTHLLGGESPPSAPASVGIPVHIDNPLNPVDRETDTAEERAAKYLKTLHLTKAGAIASSGNYRRYVEIDGVRYSHIIDPRSGMPMQGGVIGATVHTPESCMQADAIATVLSVLSPEEGRAFLKLFPKINAYLVTADGEMIEILATYVEPDPDA